MFTGIIQDLAKVVRIRKTKAGKRLSVKTSLKGVRKSDSIAINGVCLTVVSSSKGVLDFDVVPETLAKTTLGDVKRGTLVNLEPPLRAGDLIGGHFVQGHVEGTGKVLKVARQKDEVVLHVGVDPVLTRFMIHKGSIALDGVSLTVVDLADDSFTIALIPFTLEHTNLGRVGRGDRLNIETDMLGKYVLASRGGVTKEMLEKAGFLK